MLLADCHRLMIVCLQQKVSVENVPRKNLKKRKTGKNQFKYISSYNESFMKKIVVKQSI